MDPRKLSCLTVLVAASAVACGGAPTAPQKDDTFYLHGGGVIDTNESFETWFKQLDQQATARQSRRVGVGILRGDVRMTRPIDWNVRAADYTPGRRFISYQSPRQFLFSIYERVDGPQDPWPDVLQRYEKSAGDQGAEILASRMPVATANAQGRAYVVKTQTSTKPPHHAFAHEVLVRSDHRVLLVQIVHGGQTGVAQEEMIQALQSMVVY